GPQGEAIYDKFSAHDREFRQIGAGIWHDTGKWFAGGEWSRAYTDTMIAPGDSWYVTGGYRFGKLTPYLTYSGTRTHFDNIPSLSGPPFVVGGLNNLLHALLRLVNQTTITVGTRWDFAENMAFKAQFDHIKPENNSNGTLTNVQPNYDLGDSVNLLSFTLDFVF
ncbi:MAG TPA: hypothetical protein VFS17_05105, partial [Methylophilaceae bacterium]|nr:hypothetical protein [Methylophilaceae bacterium]